MVWWWYDGDMLSFFRWNNTLSLPRELLRWVEEKHLFVLMLHRTSVSSVTPSLWTSRCADCQVDLKHQILQLRNRFKLQFFWYGGALSSCAVEEDLTTVTIPCFPNLHGESARDIRMDMNGKPAIHPGFFPWPLPHLRPAICLSLARSCSNRSNRSTRQAWVFGCIWNLCWLAGCTAQDCKIVLDVDVIYICKDTHGHTYIIYTPIHTYTE